MRKFTDNVIEELEGLYNYNFEKNFNDLIIAIYMQIFSYHFDNRVAAETKYKDIGLISSTVWVDSIKNKTNDLVGIPIFAEEEEKNKFNSKSKDEKTQYILNKIRGSIVHGSFNINEDGTVTINDKNFNMTFEYDCFIDICDILYKQQFNNDDKLIELYDFITFIKELKLHSSEYNIDKLNKTSFYYLKYPILLFNLLPMNEDDIHNDPDYICFILNLFSKKDYYKNGNSKNSNGLEAKNLYKVRNCIAHGQYYFSNYDFVLFDNKDMFIFDCQSIEEQISQKIPQNNRIK